jgi:hypothetical protein
MLNKKHVIHICSDNKGGTEKYVLDLINLYNEYEHHVFNTIPFTVNNIIHDIVLIHIHATFFASNIEWDILSVIDQFRSSLGQTLPIYLTIHDYQWLFNAIPIHTLQYKDNWKEFYTTHNSKNTPLLFEKVSKIIIPVPSVYHFYDSIMELSAFPISIKNKIHIIPHCDTLIREEQLYIPIIPSSRIINIAFIAQFNEYKGARVFLDLIYNLRTYKDYAVHYHIFGKHSPSESDDSLRSYVHFHGAYKNDEIIQKLYDNGIHIQTSLSIFEETYCYSLTNLINSGLPIVYLNYGALTTRLNPAYGRMFPIENISDLYKTVHNAIEYVIVNQGLSDLIKIPHQIILREEYKQLYLPKL